MSIKTTVDQFLYENYEKIEQERLENPNFRWKTISDLLGVELSSDYVRNRFRKIRQFKDSTTIKKDLPKRILAIDIETSFNVCYSWSIGGKIRLGHDSILEERKIICISYSFLGEEKIHNLAWNNGDETKMLLEFSKVLQNADILLAHNGDNFDIKFLRTRFIYHNIPFPAKLSSIDTLKMARTNFRFNSNKLDYLGQFLGLGQKQDTGGIQLWKDIILYNNKEALAKMISYCNGDIALLKKVYYKLQEFSPTKKFPHFENDLNIKE